MTVMVRKGDEFVEESVPVNVGQVESMIESDKQAQKYEQTLRARQYLQEIEGI